MPYPWIQQPKTRLLLISCILLLGFPILTSKLFAQERWSADAVGNSGTGFSLNHPMILLVPGERYWAGHISSDIPRQGMTLCEVNNSPKGRFTEASFSVKPANRSPDLEEPHDAETIQVAGCDNTRGEQSRLFVIDKTQRLKPGMVVNASIVFNNSETGEDEQAIIMPSRPLTYRLENKFYKLALQHTPGKNDSGQYKVTLYQDGKRQTLIHRKYQLGEPTVTVVWAGDLDQDRKLDLVLTYEHDSYSVFATTLFLSSYASPHQLVVPVAKSIEPSC